MTHAEYTRLTDLKAVRTARHSIHDILDHQTERRKVLCESLLLAFDVWINQLREEIDGGKEAPSDGRPGKP